MAAEMIINQGMQYMVQNVDMRKIKKDIRLQIHKVSRQRLINNRFASQLVEQKSPQETSTLKVS